MRISGSAVLALLAAPAPLLAQEGGGLFAVESGLWIWTTLTFLVVLFILGKYAWGPILGALEAREEGIRDSIEESKRMRAEADQLLQETRNELTAARRQAQETIAGGRDAGERVRREIEAKAREEADRIIERARLEIGRERDAALEAIRREAVDLAIAAAGRILQERLDGQADRELVQRYLEEVDRAPVEA